MTLLLGARSAYPSTSSNSAQPKPSHSESIAHLLGRAIHFTGPSGGFYHDSCPANWDTPTGRCPTAGDTVDLSGTKVIFKDQHQNDDIHHPDHDTTGENFGEAVNVIIGGKGANLVLADGTFLIGNGRVLTPAPTPAPTPSPTPAPTPLCPVTCETDKGQYDGITNIHGHEGSDFGQLGRWASDPIAELYNCNVHDNQHLPDGARDANGFLQQYALQDHCNNWKRRRNHRLIATHNTAQINTQDTFIKHRCYTYGTDKKCVCECLDDDGFMFAGANGVMKSDSRFQQGTVQGNAAGIPLTADHRIDAIGQPSQTTTNGHKGDHEGQDIFREKQSSFLLHPTKNAANGNRRIVQKEWPADSPPPDELADLFDNQ